MTPSGFQKISGRNQSFISSRSELPVFVIYHDSLSCNLCQIGHLADITGLYELADSLGIFEVMTIFSPGKEEHNSVVKNLMVRDFEYPIYVDFIGNFRKTNTGIPDNRKFHSFLIDGDGHPVFVGNPVASNELWSLFLKTLVNLDDNGIL